MIAPRWFELDSALGRWRGVVTDAGLQRLDLASRSPAPPADAVRDDGQVAARELREYFAGRRRDFTVPVDLSGLTPFRRRVLETLRERVPFGATTTYAELARLAGRPGGARAVGGAVGANPVPVVVPCHRVLASGGGIGGFGFGLPAKRALLALEGVSA
jgi:methylated-DNA-[protein]-cysteine S-methyltransferase